MEEIHYAYWLNNIPGIGNKTIEALLTYTGSYEEIWELTEAQLSANPLHLSAKQIHEIIDSKNKARILSGYEKMIKKNIQFLYPYHSDFPDNLKNIYNPPQGIYVLGSLPNPTVSTIAVVGARTCSEYGRYVARKISTALAKYGFQIISGMAKGIDSIAHKGAIDEGGATFAVLGCGVDICYPQECRDICNIMSTNSNGIISEYPPLTPPKSGFFPLRNRIISALSDAVVVIEAKDKSGSLITADIALEQGKDVYALPGRVTDSLSHGCNRLIKQGAGIILSPDEFIKDLLSNYNISSAQFVNADSEFQIVKNEDVSLTNIDKKILSNLSLTPKSLTVLQIETNLSFGELSTSLLNLTIKGYVRQNDNYYNLIPN